MQLFQPFYLKGKKARNRIVMPAMCQYSATPEGMATDWHLLHYGARAVGGVGIIILEATAVEQRGRLSNHCLGIYHDSHIESLARVVECCQAQGALVGVQLAHGGRKAYGERIVAPSAIRFNVDYPIPHELRVEEIGGVVEAWREGARRAREAGFDLIQIHGAHGYLIHEFLSPLSNKRLDQYGGSFANRTRFLLEVLQAVKEEWPADRWLSVRLSAVEYVQGGLSIEDTIRIAELLQENGVDLVDISSGGNVPARPQVGPGYQLTYAEQVRRATALPTITVGLISEVEMVEEILLNQRADFVALGRALLRDPYWVLKASEYQDQEDWPQPYHRARRK